MAEMQETPLVIILADISGYTKFMVENQTSAVHGQLVISLLIEALVAEVDLPLQLQEIEGDAVFLYAKHPGDEVQWDEALRQIQGKLLNFFIRFYRSMVVGEVSTICACAVCRNADQLSLKLIVHSGTAVFHEIAGRRQISGSDVIFAHRLLKNTVDADEYMLFSDAAHAAFGSSSGLQFTPHRERYDSFGEVTTYVHLLHYGQEARQKLYGLSPEDFDSAIEQYTNNIVPSHMRALRDYVRRPITRRPLPLRAAFALGQMISMRLFSPVFLRQIRDHTRRKYANQHAKVSD